MATITQSFPIAGERKARKARVGLFRRVLNAMIESREASARRIVARHMRMHEGRINHETANRNDLPF